MSFLWTLAAGFLYAEAAIIAILLLPFISSKTWYYIFKSRLIGVISTYGSFYFHGILMILGVVLVEAYRQVQSKNQMYQELKDNSALYKPGTENVYLMKLFRAQRNLYISGFCIFLWFVFKRLVTLIADHARVTTAGEASLKQAKSATEAARRYMAEVNEGAGGKVEKDVLATEVAELKRRLEEEVAARKSAETRMDAIKKQAESTAKEYDRVATECQELQKKLAALEGGQTDKKKD